MSDELLKRVNRMCERIGESHDGYIAIVGGPMERLLIDCAERIRELEAIVADWKVSDEQYAVVVDERNRLRQYLHDEHQRHIVTMDERDDLAKLLKEARERWITVGYGASHEDVAECRDLCDRIDAALTVEKT